MNEWIRVKSAGWSRKRRPRQQHGRQKTRSEEPKKISYSRRHSTYDYSVHGELMRLRTNKINGSLEKLYKVNACLIVLLSSLHFLPILRGKKGDWKGRTKEKLRAAAAVYARSEVVQALAEECLWEQFSNAIMIRQRWPSVYSRRLNTNLQSRRIE